MMITVASLVPAPTIKQICRSARSASRSALLSTSWTQRAFGTGPPTTMPSLIILEVVKGRFLERSPRRWLHRYWAVLAHGYGLWGPFPYDDPIGEPIPIWGTTTYTVVGVTS